MWDWLRFLEHWQLFLPVGIIGGISWSVWLIRKVMSAGYRPLVNDFRTTTSVVVPSFREDPDVVLIALGSWEVYDRVLPDGRFVQLDNSQRIFDSFFKIQNIDAIVHPMSHIRPSYYGIFENNDPSRRLMVMANFDNDVPEYWEWSGEGLFPFDTSNEAYKLGVNYMIYGLTH